MRPAQPIDCVSRFPSQASVNIGRVPPAANNSVNTAAPPTPMRKLRRPPQ